jgi:hypothetical protein
MIKSANLQKKVIFMDKKYVNFGYFLQFFEYFALYLPCKQM